MKNEFWKYNTVKSWSIKNGYKLNEPQKQYMTLLLFEHLKTLYATKKLLADIPPSDLDTEFIYMKLDFLYPSLPVELSDDYSLEDMYKKYAEVDGK